MLIVARSRSCCAGDIWANCSAKSSVARSIVVEYVDCVVEYADCVVEYVDCISAEEGCLKVVEEVWSAGNKENQARQSSCVVELR